MLVHLYDRMDVSETPFPQNMTSGNPCTFAHSLLGANLCSIFHSMKGEVNLRNRFFLVHGANCIIKMIVIRCFFHRDREEGIFI